MHISEKKLLLRVDIKSVQKDNFSLIYQIKWFFLINVKKTFSCWNVRCQGYILSIIWQLLFNVYSTYFRVQEVLNGKLVLPVRLHKEQRNCNSIFRFNMSWNINIKYQIPSFYNHLDASQIQKRVSTCIMSNAQH